MKKTLFLLLIGVTVLVGLFRFKTSDDAALPKIKVSLKNPTGGGAIYIPAKSFAHCQGTASSSQNDQLRYDVEYSYDVDKDVKNITARYTLQEAGATRPVVIEKTLPIHDTVQNQSLGHGLEAFALLQE